MNVSVFKTNCTKCNHINFVDFFTIANDEKVYCLKCGNILGTIQLFDGFVYVLSNQSMPNLYKIGFTNRPIISRVEELNSPTSLPTQFDIELVFPSANPLEHEQQIHKKLDKYRINDRREFFSCSFNRIFNEIKDVTGNNPSYFRHKTLFNDIYNYSPWSTISNNTKYSDKCPVCGTKGKVNQQKENTIGKFFCFKCNRIF